SLGLMYDQGTGVQRNLSEATRWYRLAAKNGDPDAKAYLRAQNRK
ncbi:MAG: SEL1-like repeat protein, partial [Desulfovibrio sp.]|nr:SEL1-like repeat protein [Desulfovibrio sp.]